jgi:hypothetical protein
MSFVETRQLVLDTRDIGWHTTNVGQSTYYADAYTSSVGTINNRRTDATWARVNMRELIGNEMWDSYSKFNVTLRTWTMNVCADLGSTTAGTQAQYEDRSFFLMMIGPKWVNNYNVKTKNYDSSAILGVYSTTNISSSEHFVQYYNNVGVQTFGKENGPIIDLRVYFLRTVDGLPPVLNGDTSNTSPTNWVDWSVVFDITPVAASRTSKKDIVTF